MPDRTAIFTICSNNYMAYAKTLFASVAKFHPEADLYLGLADERAASDEFYPADVEILPARDLDIPDFQCFAFQYDIMEFNTAIKPFVFLELFSRGYGNVIYLDPDILLFRRLTTVMDELAGGASFVLTPHLCSPADGLEPDDLYVMRAGAYNLGFLACAWQDETESVLHWWRRRCRFDCVSNVEDGLFVDQKFFDLVPGFTANTRILRDVTLNAAYFNLGRRRLEYDGSSWSIDGKPLTFFHFSGFDPRLATVLSKHTPRFRDAEISSALAELIVLYGDELRRHGEGAEASPSYAYGSFVSGTRIPPSVRRMFRDSHASWAADPFETYEEFLHLPAFAGQGRDPAFLITNLIDYLWHKTAALKHHFDLTRTDHSEELVKWYLRQATDAFHLDQRLIEPVAERAGRQPLLPGRGAGRWEQNRPDVTLVGYFKHTGGLGEVVRQTFRCLSQTELTVHANDVSSLVLDAERRLDTSGPIQLSEQVDGRVQIFNINADQVPFVLGELRPRTRGDGYRIAVPFWELSEFPDAWCGAFDEVDEIWAPTRFIQSAIVKKTAKPVIRMPIALTFQPPKLADRDTLGLPSSKFLFFFSFDIMSFYERKNPAAVYRAFRIAFPRGTSAHVGLVIKCLNGSFLPANLAALREEIAADPDVVLVENTMTRDDMLGLIGAMDCVVSLHRAEGLGLLLSEAMVLRKPVISTDYSGSTELVLPTTGFPVEYRLTPVLDGQYPFAAGQWADPDVFHAAWQMRSVYNDPNGARDKTQLAFEHLEKNYGFAAVAARQLARLRQIGL